MIRKIYTWLIKNKFSHMIKNFNLSKKNKQYIKKTGNVVLENGDNLIVYERIERHIKMIKILNNSIK